MNDILDAVPIDKYFELFKPGAGGEGGFIRIGMNFVKSLKDRKAAAGMVTSASSKMTHLLSSSVSAVHFCALV